MKIKLTENFALTEKVIRQVRKTIKEEVIDKAGDQALQEAMMNLKTLMVAAIKGIPANSKNIRAEVKESAKVLNKDVSDLVLLKHIFNEDIVSSSYLRAKAKQPVVEDGSKISVISNGFIKVRQTLHQGDSFDTHLAKFRDRLREGIVVDADTGDMFILTTNPRTQGNMSGVKIFCSTQTGKTLDSEAAFDRYKNSPNKNVSGATPGQKAVTMTVKKRDLAYHMKKSLPVSAIFDLIKDGKYDEAKTLLASHNTSGRFSESLDKIQDLKENTNLGPEATEVNEAIQFATSIKLKKSISKIKVRYSSFGSNKLTQAAEEKYSQTLLNTFNMWKITTQGKLIQTYNKAIQKVLK